MCAGPPDMDEMPMKFPSAAEQRQDDLSLLTWFREVIRVRNAFPAIARGVTEGVDSVSDDSVAAFLRKSPENGTAGGGVYDDLLIVMNLRAETAEKDLTGIVPVNGADGAGVTPAAVLNTGEENITYEQGVLTMPGYSIAVFKLDGTAD